MWWCDKELLILIHCAFKKSIRIHRNNSMSFCHANNPFCHHQISIYIHTYSIHFALTMWQFALHTDKSNYINLMKCTVEKFAGKCWIHRHRHRHMSRKVEDNIFNIYMYMCTSLRKSHMKFHMKPHMTSFSVFIIIWIYVCRNVRLIKTIKWNY